MVKVIASEVRKGNVLDIEGQLCTVMKAESIRPGKGTPTTHIDMRRISDGVKIVKSYRTTESVERAILDTIPMEYLYSDGDMHHFMSQENYEQVTLSNDALGDTLLYILPNSVIKVDFYEGMPVGVELPNTVILEIIETEPGMKGATASSSYKPAKMQTGLVVQIPPFVEAGAKIEIDTRENKYLRRV